MAGTWGIHTLYSESYRISGLHTCWGFVLFWYPMILLIENTGHLEQRQIFWSPGNNKNFKALSEQWLVFRHLSSGFILKNVVQLLTQISMHSLRMVRLFCPSWNLTVLECIHIYLFFLQTYIQSIIKIPKW